MPATHFLMTIALDGGYTDRLVTVYHLTYTGTIISSLQVHLAIYKRCSIFMNKLADITIWKQFFFTLLAYLKYIKAILKSKQEISMIQYTCLSSQVSKPRVMLAESATSSISKCVP